MQSSQMVAKLEAVKWKIASDESLSLADKNYIARACMLAVMTISFHRPGVSAKMRDCEYREMIQQMAKNPHEKPRIHVRDHKTENNQPATVLLTEKELEWFQLYADHVRPQR
jgi:hypothetical protein